MTNGIIEFLNIKEEIESVIFHSKYNGLLHLT